MLDSQEGSQEISNTNLLDGGFAPLEVKPLVGDIFRHILDSYIAYDGDLKAVYNIDADKYESAVRKCLPMVMRCGYFYSGKYDSKENLPIIKLIERLALVGPKYPKSLKDKVSNLFHENVFDEDVFDLQGFENCFNKVIKEIEADIKVEQALDVKHLFSQLVDNQKRGYLSPQLNNLNVDLNIPNWFNTVLTDDNESAENVFQQLEGNGDKVLAADLRVKRADFQAKINKQNREIERLEIDMHAVRFKFNPSIGEHEDAARQRLCEDLIKPLCVGEAGIAGEGAKESLGKYIAGIVSFSAFRSNFALVLPATMSLLEDLRKTDEDKSWLYNLFHFKLKIFYKYKSDKAKQENSKEISDRKELSKSKKAASVFALLTTIAVGGLFGYLSFIEGYALWSGIMLGISATPLGLGLFVGALVVGSCLGYKFDYFSNKKTLAILAFGALLCISPHIALGAVIVGVGLIAASTVVAMGALLGKDTIDFIKDDGLSKLGTFFKERFAPSCFKSLTWEKKLTHIFVNCPLELIKISINLAVNVLSLVGQFIFFSAAMIKTFGSPAVGYSLAGMNSGLHIFFQVPSFQTWLDNFFGLFTPDTYAKIDKRESELSNLQKSSDKKSIYDRTLGQFFATGNGFGYGLAIAAKVLAKKTPVVVGVIAVLAFLHIPVAAGIILFAAAAIACSIMPSQNGSNGLVEKARIARVTVPDVNEGHINTENVVPFKGQNFSIDSQDEEKCFESHDDTQSQKSVRFKLGDDLETVITERNSGQAEILTLLNAEVLDYAAASTTGASDTQLQLQEEIPLGCAAEHRLFASGANGQHGNTLVPVSRIVGCGLS